jgi:RNA polymerase sigma-70 factor (ECF subfamily)
MMTGFPPTIRSSRCISVDPQKVLIWFTTPHPAPILTVERTRQKILSALDILTHQEREAFLMVVGEGLSYREVAEMMGVKRSTVQCYVERAREKIKKRQKRSE